MKEKTDLELFYILPYTKSYDKNCVEYYPINNSSLDY